MSRGERGPKGDHGQDGQDGQTGKDGRVSHVTRNQVLALFALTVLGLLLSAYRSEGQSADLRRVNLEMRVGVYNQCQVAYGNAQDLRRLIDELVVTVKLRPDLTDERKKSLTAVYISAKPRLLDCGARPR